MLKVDEAKACLSEWRLPSDEDRVEREVGALPEKLRKLAKCICWRWTDEERAAVKLDYDYEKVRNRKRAAAAEVDRLPVKERAKIFSVVSPGLAPHMEQTWQLLKTTPYQSGHTRKAFRAPHNPELLAEFLLDWMIGMAELGKRYPANVLTPTWLATWTPHLTEDYHGFESEVASLLAGVLNQKNKEADEVFDILLQSLYGQHEIGGTGRHVYQALLLSNREAGWEAIEKTLLAAQRQEGLRQAILEVMDFTHPEAFRRMLRLILEHDLQRFSSVVRAVDVWFGELWNAASGGVIKKMLQQLVEFSDEPATRTKALKGKDAEAAYLALWCAATEDAMESQRLAKELLSAKSAELRYVAARHLVNLETTSATIALAPALDDEDLRVAAVAVTQIWLGNEYDGGEVDKSDNRFEQLERLIQRVPEKSQKLKPIVWPWTEQTLKRSTVTASLLPTLGERHATRLIPHLQWMEPGQRRAAAEVLVKVSPWDDATRSAVVELAGDASADARTVALEALLKQSLAVKDYERLEGYLTRQTGDVRRGVLAILLKQEDDDALASGRRLLTAKDASQRLAGLELLRLMAEAKRSIAECRAQAAAYEAERKKVTKDERAHLDDIATDKVAAPTLDDALGFMNPAERTPIVPPRNLKVPYVTPAAVACLQALDDLVHEHRETSIRYKSYRGEQEELLGNIQWGFPSPNFRKTHKNRKNQEERLPLADVWLTWRAKRDKAFKDADGLELVRAYFWSKYCNEWRSDNWLDWAKSSPQRKAIAETLSGGQKPLNLRYSGVVTSLVQWLLFLSPVDAGDYLLDALETAYSLVPANDMARLGEATKGDSGERYWNRSEEDADWRDTSGFDDWLGTFGPVEKATGFDPTPEQEVRLWRLLHWSSEPFPGARRRRPPDELVMAAYTHGAANLTDIADQLLGPRGSGRYRDEGFDLLETLTKRKPNKDVEQWLKKAPEVRDMVERSIGRILDLELSRGDAATAATLPAYALKSLSGIETLRRILHALGKNEFKVGPSWRSAANLDRRQTLTHLAKVTFPADVETPTDFVAIMKRAVGEGQFPEERLLQLLFLSPQWMNYIEAYLGWEQMGEGVYWFLAHMNYIGGLGEAAAEAAGEVTAETAASTDDDTVSDDVSDDDDDDEDDADGKPSKKLSAWERLIVERTPLTEEERNEGAIDVPWFKRTYAELGEKHWQRLATAARFAANASQAKRATFIADVLLNRVSRKTLVDGIKKRQLKDHVRLLGLLPLAKSAKGEADLLERCRILREYRRYANQLSGLTKPSALRSWEIGMRNMAQTAGYADPLRLEWAVGAEAVKDLCKGPVEVTKGGVSVILALDEMSKPVLTVRKGDKELKSIPPAIKKDKKIAALTGRVTELKRQASSIRQSLEAAMCRGDVFTGTELREWCGHALLAPLLARLVVVGEGILGYPDKQGKALRDHRGKFEPVKAAEKLRLAHPHDLLESKAWHDWQRECFQSERMQPFKQVFRELYVVTKQERKDKTVSHRYDGHQVQTKQALALFGQRGWNTQDGIFKVFHDLELTAMVAFDSGVTTPAEVEGPSFAGISFHKRDQLKPMPLVDVPPRLFSEVMRDLDLVVSVAHAGGVDPEASASTVEMRGNLLRETCELLKLKNVRFKPSHVLVDGELANYSVHLGSGSVQKMPGGSLCVVPVHAQQRGRLFLPFADDDPRTAEVISKVLLLARDREIQDPTILEQIRA